MRALVYFRSKGETTSRALGPQEMKALPLKSSDVTLDVDEKLAQVRVMDRRGSFLRWCKRPRNLSLSIEGA